MRAPALLLSLLVTISTAAPAIAADPCDNGAGSRRGHRLRDWLNGKHGHCRDCFQLDCGRGKTHHDFGCTGCKGECIFVFGSCWDYFEEPCYPKLPPMLPPYPYPYPYPFQRPPTAEHPAAVGPVTVP
jgi:hypothetical protein